jgi:hypothetical protein
VGSQATLQLVHAETSAGSLLRQARSGEPALKLPRYKSSALKILELILLTLSLSLPLSQRATFLLSFPILPPYTSQHREFHSGALLPEWRGEWILPFPFPSLLSLSISHHRGSQHSHSAVSLSTGSALILPTKTKKL